MEDIHKILDKFKPKVFSLSEANFDIFTDEKIDQYSIEATDMGMPSPVA